MAAHLREGSRVDMVGVTNALVTNITDQYIEIEYTQPGGQTEVRAISWAYVTQIVVVSD